MQFIQTPLHESIVGKVLTVCPASIVNCTLENINIGRLDLPEDGMKLKDKFRLAESKSVKGADQDEMFDFLHVDVGSIYEVYKIVVQAVSLSFLNDIILAIT